jgi:metallothiol transferase
MNIKKIYACWIYVSDLNKSIDFYQNAIGFRIKFIEDEWIEFDLGETSFAILKRPSSKGKVVPQKTRIMFETNDIESLYHDLRDKNVTFIGEIRNEPYGKLLTFEDPDGHWLEFFQE